MQDAQSLPAAQAEEIFTWDAGIRYHKSQGPPCTSTRERYFTAMRWTATAQVAVAAGVLAPVTASAQLEIAPQIGLYIPRGPLIKEGSPSNPSTELQKRPEGSLLLGVRALFWATKRFAVVAGISFAPSPVGSPTPWARRTSKAESCLRT